MNLSKLGMILSIIGAIIGGGGTVINSIGDYNKTKETKKED